MHKSNLVQASKGPALLVKIKHNPFMDWWQASLWDADKNRPYRANVSHLVVAGSYDQCLAETEAFLTEIGATWEIVKTSEEPGLPISFIPSPEAAWLDAVTKIAEERGLNREFAESIVKAYEAMSDDESTPERTSLYNWARGFLGEKA